MASCACNSVLFCWLLRPSPVWTDNMSADSTQSAVYCTNPFSCHTSHFHLHTSVMSSAFSDLCVWVCETKFVQGQVYKSYVLTRTNLIKCKQIKMKVRFKTVRYQQTLKTGHSHSMGLLRNNLLSLDWQNVV